MPSHEPTRIIQLRLRVATEKHEALLAFLREAIPFYEEPGGIRIRLLRSLDDPKCFVEVVEYRDADAYARDEHRLATDERMKAFLDRWHTLLDDRAEVEEYEELTEMLSTGKGGVP